MSFKYLIVSLLISFNVAFVSLAYASLEDIPLLMRLKHDSLDEELIRK